ncbi:MAG: hypothetical protein GY754_07495 [bacterium]|nr:hypothetical protein [bacterium]
MIQKNRKFQKNKHTGSGKSGWTYIKVFALVLFLVPSLTYAKTGAVGFEVEVANVEILQGKGNRNTKVMFSGDHFDATLEPNESGLTVEYVTKTFTYDNAGSQKLEKNVDEIVLAGTSLITNFCINFEKFYKFRYTKKNKSTPPQLGTMSAAVRNDIFKIRKESITAWEKDEKNRISEIAPLIKSLKDKNNNTIFSNIQTGFAIRLPEKFLKAGHGFVNANNEQMPYPEMGAHIQATLDIRLDRVPDLLKEMSTNPYLMYQGKPYYSMLKKCIEAAEKENAINKNPELLGFTTFLSFYIVSGRIPVSDKIKHYNKSHIPLMARVPLNDYYNAIPKQGIFEDNNHDEDFIKLVLKIANSAAPNLKIKANEQVIFYKGHKKGPKIEDWIRGLLSEKGGKDLFKTNTKESGTMEMTDVDGKPAAILEIRKMPGGLYQSEWKKRIMAIFKYSKKLNKDADVSNLHYVVPN